MAKGKGRKKKSLETLLRNSRAQKRGNRQRLKLKQLMMTATTSALPPGVIMEVEAEDVIISGSTIIKSEPFGGISDSLGGAEHVASDMSADAAENKSPNSIKFKTKQEVATPPPEVGNKLSSSVAPKRPCKMSSEEYREYQNDSRRRIRWLAKLSEEEKTKYLEEETKLAAAEGGQRISAFKKLETARKGSSKRLPSTISSIVKQEAAPPSEIKLTRTKKLTIRIKTEIEKESKEVSESANMSSVKLKPKPPVKMTPEEYKEHERDSKRRMRWLAKLSEEERTKYLEEEAKLVKSSEGETTLSAFKRMEALRKTPEEREKRRRERDRKSKRRRRQLAKISEMKVTRVPIEEQMLKEKSEMSPEDLEALNAFMERKKLQDPELAATTTPKELEVNLWRLWKRYQRTEQWRKKRLLDFGSEKTERMRVRQRAAAKRWRDKKKQEGMTTPSDCDPVQLEMHRMKRRESKRKSRLKAKIQPLVSEEVERERRQRAIMRRIERRARMTEEERKEERQKMYMWRVARMSKLSAEEIEKMRKETRERMRMSGKYAEHLKRARERQSLRNMRKKLMIQELTKQGKSLEEIQHQLESPEARQRRLSQLRIRAAQRKLEKKLVADGVAPDEIERQLKQLAETYKPVRALRTYKPRKRTPLEQIQHGEISLPQGKVISKDFPPPAPPSFQSVSCDPEEHHSQKQEHEERIESTPDQFVSSRLNDSDDDSDVDDAASDLPSNSSTDNYDDSSHVNPPRLSTVSSLNHIAPSLPSSASASATGQVAKRASVPPLSSSVPPESPVKKVGRPLGKPTNKSSGIKRDCICDICGNAYRRQELVIHMKRVHHPYYQNGHCSICSGRFKPPTFQDHFRTVHIQNGDVSWESLDKRFHPRARLLFANPDGDTSRSRRSRSVAQAEISRDVKRVVCEDCGSILRRKCLLEHRRKFHNPHYDKMSGRCTLCGEELKGRQYYRHFETAHPDAAVQSTIIERKHICDECGTTCAHLGSSKTHKYLIHGAGSLRENFIRCPECPEEKVFKTKNHFQTHRRLVHREVSLLIQCRFCPVQLSTKNEEYEHLREKHRDQCWPCLYCNVVRFSEIGILSHYSKPCQKITLEERRRWAKEKRDMMIDKMLLKCKLCSNEIHLKSLMRHYKETHEIKEENYRCWECEKSFKLRFYLGLHLLEGHGMQPDQWLERIAEVNAPSVEAVKAKQMVKKQLSSRERVRVKRFIRKRKIGGGDDNEEVNVPNLKAKKKRGLSGVRKKKLSRKNKTFRGDEDEENMELNAGTKGKSKDLLVKDEKLNGMICSVYLQKTDLQRLCSAQGIQIEDCHDYDLQYVFI